MKRTVNLGLGLLACIVVLTGVTYAGLLRLGVLPRLAFAPGWSLTDQNGTHITSESHRGSIVLYTFSYSQVRDPRRNTAGVMREVQELLKREDTDGIPVRLVTISFDARQDTTENLRNVSSLAGADTSLWRYVSGDQATIRRVVKEGFGVFYESQKDGHFSFDPVFILVDGMGIIRAQYDLGLPSPEHLVRDIRSLIKEARAASGPGRYAYEAAHLFSCYSNVSL